MDIEEANADVYALLGSINLRFEKYDLATNQLNRAIELNPNHVGVVGGLGAHIFQAGDDQGIVLVRRAMKLDPFHPTWLHFSIADHHFQRGEYQEALANAQKIDMPGYFWTPVFLAGAYAELGRPKEAQSAVEELLKLYPGFTIETLIEEHRKWNRPDDVISRWVVALRKAGLPE